MCCGGGNWIHLALSRDDGRDTVVVVMDLLEIH